MKQLTLFIKKNQREITALNNVCIYVYVHTYLGSLLILIKRINVCITASYSLISLIVYYQQLTYFTTCYTTAGELFSISGCGHGKQPFNEYSASCIEDRILQNCLEKEMYSDRMIPGSRCRSS